MTAVPRAGAAGAMTFDGLAIGYVPGLEGQTGDALARAAAALLFALASLIVAGQLMLGRVVPVVLALDAGRPPRKVRRHPLGRSRNVHIS